jgi:hypothetical protein
MSFLTQLSPDAAPRLAALMQQHLLPGGTSALKVRARVWCLLPRAAPIGAAATRCRMHSHTHTQPLRPPPPPQHTHKHVLPHSP